jgi:hypothetical protein
VADDPKSALGRFARALRSADVGAKAREVGRSLKAEFDAGRSGDDSEPRPIWGTPKEQLAAMLALLHNLRRPAASGDQPLASADDAQTVADAVDRIDWSAVRTATGERGGDAVSAMRTMAAQVDWSRMPPMVGRMSSALLAAVASGQLPVAGPLGPLVARAIVNEGGLGQHVAERVADTGDFRNVIDTTARDE